VTIDPYSGAKNEEVTSDMVILPSTISSINNMEVAKSTMLCTELLKFKLSCPRNLKNLDTP
jgi:hypothetical protein